MPYLGSGSFLFLNPISASSCTFIQKIGGVIDRLSKSNQLNLENLFGGISITIMECLEA